MYLARYILLYIQLNISTGLLLKKTLYMISTIAYVLLLYINILYIYMYVSHYSFHYPINISIIYIYYIFLYLGKSYYIPLFPNMLIFIFDKIYRNTQIYPILMHYISQIFPIIYPIYIYSIIYPFIYPLRIIH